MRPGALSLDGFLGPAESLLDILAHDNDLVTVEMGLTHQEIAKHLLMMKGINRWLARHAEYSPEFRYHGERFSLQASYYGDSQPSPFRDGTSTDEEIVVRNVGTGKALWYSVLVPYMIERYGFYEGKGTRYRVDPREIREVFAFLRR